MRFIIMHKTNAHWEAGAIPDQGLIARVGALLAELGAAGAFISGEGLRPSSQGARVRYTGAERTIADGPFERGNELPDEFSILRVASLEEAVEWASRQAEILGDVEIDIRPVTEPWDIGITDRPVPEATRRYMVLRKATAESEAGAGPSGERRAQFTRLIDETRRAGILLANEALQPSRRGRRYKNSSSGITFFDGPMVETKELIGGYVVIETGSFEEAHRWALKYIAAVGAEEVDLREAV